MHTHVYQNPNGPLTLASPVSQIGQFESVGQLTNKLGSPLVANKSLFSTLNAIGVSDHVLIFVLFGDTTPVTFLTNSCLLWRRHIYDARIWALGCRNSLLLGTTYESLSFPHAC
jgi:hypothetical protein